MEPHNALELRQHPEPDAGEQCEGQHARVSARAQDQGLRLLRLYFADWLCFLVAGAVGGLPQVLLTPVPATWSPDDPSLQQRRDRGPHVPNNLLHPVVLLPTLSLLLLTEVLCARLQARPLNRRTLHHVLLGWFGAVTTTIFCQGLLSIVAGLPRPQFLSACKPSPASFSAATAAVCTDSVSANLYRSFPCGHCSYSTSNYLYLSLFLASKLDAWDGQGHAWKQLVTLTPTLGAVIISITRISDGEHHIFDVVIGVLLGASIAVYMHWTYFCSPFGPARGLPRCVRDTLGMPPELITLETTAGLPPPLGSHELADGSASLYSNDSSSASQSSSSRSSHANRYCRTGTASNTASSEREPPCEGDEELLQLKGGGTSWSSSC